MKFYPSQVKNLVDSIKNGKISSALLYGPDSGEISNIVQYISSELDLIVRSIDLSRDDNSSLSVLLQNRNMFNKSYLIKITNVSNFNNFLKDILAQSHSHIPIIIGGELKKSSALLKFFMQENNVACIGCYNQDEQARTRQISNLLQKSGKIIHKDALDYLAYNISGNSLLLEQEIQKLLTIVGSKQNIELSDAKNIKNSNFSLTIDDLFFTAIEQDQSKFLNILDILHREKYNEISILHGLGHYFSSIYQCLYHMQLGFSQNQAMGMLQMPIFYKYQPRFTKLLQNFDIKFAGKMLNILNELEINVKKGHRVDFFMDIYMILKHKNTQN